MLTAGMYDYRARSYDPATGRFAGEDPSGFSAGDANLYGYVGNDPLNNTDPMGLCGWGNSNGLTTGVLTQAQKAGAINSMEFYILGMSTQDEWAARTLMATPSPQYYDTYESWNAYAMQSAVATIADGLPDVNLNRFIYSQVQTRRHPISRRNTFKGTTNSLSPVNNVALPTRHAGGRDSMQNEVGGGHGGEQRRGGQLRTNACSRSGQDRAGA